jgi:hypothetical protein
MTTRSAIHAYGPTTTTARTKKIDPCTATTCITLISGSSATTYRCGVVVVTSATTGTTRITGTCVVSRVSIAATSTAY